MPYGTWYQYFNGLDVTINARVGRSLTVMAGTSTGQTVADNCDVRAHLPELATTATGTSAFGAGLNTSVVTMASPYCHVAYGMLTQFRGLASYDRPEDWRASSRRRFRASPARCWRPTMRRRTRLSRLRSAGISRAMRPMSLSTWCAPGTAVRRSHQPIRPSSRQDPEVRSLAHVDRVRCLQRAQLERGVDLQQYLRSRRPWLQPLTILTPRFFKITAEIHL